MCARRPDFSIEAKVVGFRLRLAVLPVQSRALPSQIRDNKELLHETKLYVSAQPYVYDSTDLL